MCAGPEVCFECSGPEWYISTMQHASDIPFWSGTTSLSRVLDQNGISRLCNMLQIYHSGPEQLHFRGFRTRMVYLYYATCFIYTILVRNYFTFEGSGPEWYISTMQHASDIPFWSGTLESEVVYRDCTAASWSP